MPGAGALDLFDPRIAAWFRDEVGTPTEVQERAWPVVARGDHALVTAPTGSGKTLTAFLWALDRLLTGAWPGGRVRVLYVSPLRALNADVRRNLLHPLARIAERFAAAGEPAPEVQVLTRSGDTPQADRARMRRRPPEVLITTPESLNILLTSASGRAMLDGLATVILDEVHAVAGTKRGTHLITAVDRLVPLAGNFQRVALSATVKPLEAIAAWVGGEELRYLDGEASYRPRRVAVVRSDMAKTLEVEVRWPARAATPPSPQEQDEDGVWRILVPAWKEVIHDHRSTLFFANSRRMTEKVTRLINEEEPEDLAYAHHGSLSREVRTVVEKRLKDGDLKAIVATSSLELGIDVGALDAVVLVSTPPSISAAVQRVGRAGHRVGETSRGVLFPIHGRDFLHAAVVARAAVEKDIEPIRPLEGPLDVLAQIVLSMTATETWELGALYDRLRASAPYRRLARRQLERVVEMLAGRYADSRIRELRPRVHLDRAAGTVRARPGAARLVYLAGGTIPDRGYFTLRLEGSDAKLGELDEEFVWERSLGDTFVLGTQSWRIERITHDEVRVSPGGTPTAMAPFWRADAQDRDAHFSGLVAAFLARADGRLDDPLFARELAELHRLDPGAVAALLELLRAQRAAGNGRLPHRRHLLVERVAEAMGRVDRQPLVLHTFWGGRVNRPFAMALQAAWEESRGETLEVYQDDDCLLVHAPPELAVDDLLALVPSDQVETLVRRKLESSGFFGARFRAAAGTALLLPRAGFERRTPLWLTRQRAKKLADAVARYGDFPILLEAWRTCLEDDLEPGLLADRLGELERGEIEVSEVVTSTPSPFAAEVVWQETSRLMYEDDTPEAARRGGVRPDLIQEVVFSTRLRPRLPAELVERFRRKVQRTAPGYAPSPGAELRDWIAERLWLAGEEWRELLDAVAADAERSAAELVAELADAVATVRFPEATKDVVVAAEALPRVRRGLGLDPPVAGDEAGPTERLADLVGEHLRFQGPVGPERLATELGLESGRLAAALDALHDAQRVVVDRLTAGGDAVEVCDAENLEILLRWLRHAARPGFETRAASELPLFLAVQQGLVPSGDGIEALQARLERLFGLPLPASLWEKEVLPARLRPYYPAWLDSLLQESDLGWLGTGPERLTFVLAEELDVLRDPPPAAPDPAVAAFFADADARFPVEDLARRSGRPAAWIHDELWRLAWAGGATNDGFAAVRRGLASKFAPPSPGVATGGPRRAGFDRGLDRWRTAKPFPGQWRAVPPPPDELDALERDELAKERARLLLERWGVVARELLVRELPELQWGRVFRALRLMELSGEVLAGRFFAGLRGLQFASPAAYRRLAKGAPSDAVWWLSAADPASLCGVDVEGLKSELPKRQASTHLVYHGTRLVLLSRRRGHELEVRVTPEDPSLDAYLEPLRVRLTRGFQPASHVEVETINGEPAGSSPYLEPFARSFRVVREGRSAKLWKRY